MGICSKIQHHDKLQCEKQCCEMTQEREKKSVFVVVGTIIYIDFPIFE